MGKLLQCGVTQPEEAQNWVQAVEGGTTVSALA